MNVIGPPRRPEINQYAIKFIIGAIAFSLPIIEWFLTGHGLTSISQSFWWPDPWPRNFFVGFLFAISALLLSYNGQTEVEMWLTKVASLAGFLIAMFPCACDPPETEIIPHLHEASAAVMFLVLAAFCYIFMRRAHAKGHREARWRSYIYAVSGAGTIVGFVLFAIYLWSRKDPLLLYGEWAGLASFGVSWLTASHVLPVINRASEQRSLFART